MNNEELKMFNYLEEHAYISQNKKSNYQFELTKERAESIACKHRSLCEEKDKEIDRLNNIINELEKYLENVKTNLRYIGVKWDNDCLIRAEVIQQVLHKLKELKESDNNER